MAGAVVSTTARHTGARGGGQGPCHCKEERVHGSFCIGAVSRNSNIDCGLFCSESRGTFANMLVRTRAPRCGPHPRVGHVGPDSVIFFVENRNSFSFLFLS